MIFTAIPHETLPNQFSHIFQLIYVRVERARKIAAFHCYSRQNGLYIQLVRSYAKRVYVLFALVSWTKVIVYVCHDRLAVFTKLSKRSDHSSCLNISLKNWPKSMRKPWTHISRKNYFSTAVDGESVQICVLTHILRWICVSYDGTFWRKKTKSTKHVNYRIKRWFYGDCSKMSSLPWKEICVNKAYVYHLTFNGYSRETHHRCVGIPMI